MNYLLDIATYQFSLLQSNMPSHSKKNENPTMICIILYSFLGNFPTYEHTIREHKLLAWIAKQIKNRPLLYNCQPFVWPNLFTQETLYHLSVQFTCQWTLTKLYAPKTSNLAGNNSTTSKCMCCEATKVVNRFHDSLPVRTMPGKLNWPWFPCLLTIRPALIPCGATSGHQIFLRCSLLIFLMRVSSWRITFLTDFK